jgi:hypothetical protein
MRYVSHDSVWVRGLTRQIVPMYCKRSESLESQRYRREKCVSYRVVSIYDYEMSHREWIRHHEASSSLSIVVVGSESRRRREWISSPSPSRRAIGSDSRRHRGEPTRRKSSESPAIEKNRFFWHLIGIFTEHRQPWVENSRCGFESSALSRELAIDFYPS